MDSLQRAKGKELAIILVDGDSDSAITPEQIEDWADHDLEEWLGVQGYVWSDDEEEWVIGWD